MSDQVESPSREAIKAQARLQRCERKLSETLGETIDKVNSSFMWDLCDCLIKIHTSLQQGDDRSSSIILERRLQNLLDYVYLDFEKGVRNMVDELYEGEGEVTLVFERNYGTVKTTKITVKAD